MIFDPVTLPGDREDIIQAHAVCHSEKNRIYAQHSAVAKLAHKKGDSALLKASAEWQEQSDMITSTAFDLKHFDAQIRRAKKLGNSYGELEKTRSAVLRRNLAATKAFPAAKEKVERLYKAATCPSDSE